MKRILVITLTLVMLLAALTGCMASKNPSGSEGEQNPQTFKLSIIGDYADNVVSELKGSYAAGERVAMELQTITEHYYEVTVNGTQIPQADSDWEYTWFVFNMPAEDTIVSITQKALVFRPLLLILMISLSNT